MRLSGLVLQEAGMSSVFCRDRARRILEDLGMTEPPIDVEAVARRLGLEVRYVLRPVGFEGRLIRERMVIEVNQRNHRHKQRFTISHEIGHFVLAHSPVFSSFDDRGIADPGRVNERQANAFASELLMPESAVRAYWSKVRRLERPNDKMAEAFEVSPQAMWYRLEELDLLGLPPARSARPEY
jgi:Zn-dependent peptidase ImmA (M78 family)